MGVQPRCNVCNFIGGGVMLVTNGCDLQGDTSRIILGKVPDLNALIGKPQPRDGELVQVLMPIVGGEPKVVLYVFNTMATEGVMPSDGTAGRWNLVHDVVIQKPVRIIFGSYLPSGTIFDLNSLPVDATNVFGNSLTLDNTKQLYMLNDLEVGFTALGASTFKLAKSVHQHSKLELIPIKN